MKSYTIFLALFLLFFSAANAQKVITLSGNQPPELGCSLSNKTNDWFLPSIEELNLLFQLSIDGKLNDMPTGALPKREVGLVVPPGNAPKAILLIAMRIYSQGMPNQNLLTITNKNILNNRFYLTV